mmetsp:Transcript_135777/g.378383  ORF Transcript_135777/g.378383 Transcript_135777/m.378383 type:complete len:241 (+) Transcript_135777:115-837(+)
MDRGPPLADARAASWLPASTAAVNMPWTTEELAGSCSSCATCATKDACSTGRNCNAWAAAATAAECCPLPPFEVKPAGLPAALPLGPGAAGAVGLCSQRFTSTHLSSTKLSGPLASASSTPEGESKLTTPKPLLRPVLGSMWTLASVTLPNCEKKAPSLASSQDCGKPPTKTRKESKVLLASPGPPIRASSQALHSTVLPSTTWLPSRRTASTDSCSSKVTKPKPRERPVSLSNRTTQSH